MRKWKVGDRVKCLSDRFTPRRVFKDTTYVIERIVPLDERYVKHYLAGTDAYFYFNSHELWEYIPPGDFNELMAAPDKSELFRYLKREADNII